jgi:hypothetical protein
MSTREEVEYARRTDEVEAPGSRLPLQEPVDHAEMLEGPQELQRATEAPKESIDDVVSRLIIHEDKPIENLPTMTAPELKLIGRCVSLSTKQTINGVTAQYYYTGLVSAVTATAVTLMYVNRYTEEDFKLYKEREKKCTAGRDLHDFPDGDSSAAQALVLTAAEAHATVRDPIEREADVSHFPYSLSEVFGNAFGAAAAARAAAVRSGTDPRASLCPAVQMVTGAALERLAPHRCRSGTEHTAVSVDTTSGDSSRCTPAQTFRTCGGSLGPLPCVTFLRKNVNGVQFGRSPNSSFYSLFQDPMKRLMDMQYLHVFIRRYVVHTSQGGNLKQVSLCAYLAERGGSAAVDHDLVKPMVRDEVAELMKQDRAIAKEKKRLRNREARREASLRDYRAPPGVFANTGFLYLTGIPQGTLLTAAALLFFTCAFAANFALPVVYGGDALTQSLFSELYDRFVAALLMWTATSVVAFFHAFAMRVPSITNAPVMIIRGLSSVGAAVYAILCIVLISHCSGNEYIEQRMRMSPQDALCSFYKQHRCSGFYVSCGTSSRNDPLCEPCLPVWYPDSSCYNVITDQLQRVMIPLFLFSIVVFLCAVHSVFLLLKLLLIARATSISSHV